MASFRLAQQLCSENMQRKPSAHHPLPTLWFTLFSNRPVPGLGNWYPATYGMDMKIPHTLRYSGQFVIVHENQSRAEAKTAA